MLADIKCLNDLGEMQGFMKKNKGFTDYQCRPILNPEIFTTLQKKKGFKVSGFGLLVLCSVIFLQRMYCMALGWRANGASMQNDRRRRMCSVMGWIICRRGQLFF